MIVRGGSSRADSGAALATTVLFALVVLMAGHGILVFARTQRWIAASDGPRWAGDEARKAALDAVATGRHALPPAGTVETRWGPVQVGEIGPELRLLSAEPSAASPGIGWATLLAAADPVSRARQRSGAVRVGGSVFDSGTSLGGSDEPCPVGLDGVSAARSGPLPEGPGRPTLGVLELDELIEALPLLAEGRLDLPDPASSACEDPGGFGDPERPGSCSGVWGAGGRRGDLTLSGAGQGVLAVSGDLTLIADARFRGWIWVGGDLRVSTGAELRGLADVGGRLTVEPGGAFAPDECSGARALEATPSLRVPRRVGPWAWPLFPG